MCSRPGDPRGPEIIVPEPRHLERQLGRVATASRMTLVELVGSGMILDARGDTTRRTSVHRGRAPLHEVVARASRKTLVQVCNAGVRDVVVRLAATRISGAADAVVLMQLSLDHHRTVLEAIRCGDGEGAARDCTRCLFRLLRDLPRRARPRDPECPAGLSALLD